MTVQTINGKFKYDKDTRKMHRFTIITEGAEVELSGSIYIPKDGPGIPRQIVLVNSNNPIED